MSKKTILMALAALACVAVADVGGSRSVATAKDGWRSRGDRPTANGESRVGADATKRVPPAGVVAISDATKRVPPVSVVAISDATKRVPPASVIAISDATERVPPAGLAVSFDARTGFFDVADAASGRSWRALSSTPPFASLSNVRVSSDAKRLSFDAVVSKESGETVRGALAVEGNEVLCTLEGDAALAPSGLAWPAAFAGAVDERLLLPHGPGFAFPCQQVDLGAAIPNRLQSYTRDFNMGVWAHYAERTEGDGSLGFGAGYAALVETPVDLKVDISVRSNGLRAVGPVWQGERGRLGYARRIRYVFWPDASPAKVAARYRAFLRGKGELKTLLEKKRENPKIASAIDDLAGAPDVWYWTIGGDKPRFARDLKALGFDNFFFCFATRKDLGVWRTEEEVARIAELPRVIPCEYDVYTDTMESRYLPLIEYVRPYWSIEAADAGDIVFGANGKPVRGWKVAFKGERDGSTNAIGCAHICEQRAPKYVVKRLSKELLAFPGYRARFLDVTGTSVGTCFNPAHPHTRRQSAGYRREIFRTVQERFGLLCGTEEGIEPFVDVTCYSEGPMTSPRHRTGGGRFMWQIIDDVPETVVRGMDPAVRVPFRELVFHDCNVSYWYWTDYNNKFPSLWRRKDLMNALYGTPPMYFFDEKSFARQRGNLAESFRTATPVSRKTAFSAMTNFRLLSADRLVQETTFANGTKVTVNFASHPFRLPSGRTLDGESLFVE